jgi:reductive dehalogenase
MEEQNIVQLDENKEPEEKKVNRRDFFKIGVVGAALGTVAAVELPGKAVAETVSTQLDKKLVKEWPGMPVKISSDYKRMAQKNTIFNRAASGDAPKLQKIMGRYYYPELRKEPGWTQLDYALSKAAWSVNDTMAPLSQSGRPNTPAYRWDMKPDSQTYRFNSTHEATKAVKRAARFLGADLVGIARYDERWVYSSFYDTMKKQEIPADLPFKPKSVIVMAIEMDYAAFGTAPTVLASAGAAKGYSEMAATATSVAHFISNLGYKAFGAGNDIAMSVPYAVAAGLGEAARNGLVVTYKYGPRVRLCKVFTEMELEHDKPKTFGVRHFCENCMRCADACPSKAISKDKKPSFKVNNKSNNPGVEKWAIDAEKCFEFWCKNGGDCGTCISSCPYNKPEFWHHKMVDKLTVLMPGAVHSFMKEMDIVFGYGNTYDKKAVKRFWNEES